MNIRNWVRRAGIGLFAAAVVSTSSAVLAQGSYPTQPVTIVVPTAPGGGVDQIARLLGAEFEKIFGQPFVVENVPGANGNIGTQQVARSEADGYTLLIGSSGFMLSPQTYAEQPYDPVNDFVPIADLAEVPYLFVANKDVGINSIADLIARAKANPEELFYASQVGGPPNLMMEAFKLTADISVTHLPTTGGGPNMQAVLTGTAQVSLGSMPNFISQVQAGEITAIAITGDGRWPDLPDVPTMAEQGFSGFFPEATHVFLAPAGTPPEIVQALSEATLEVLGRPEIQETLHAAGFSVVAGGPDVLAARIVADGAAFGGIVEAINFQKY